MGSFRRGIRFFRSQDVIFESSPSFIGKTYPINLFFNFFLLFFFGRRKASTGKESSGWMLISSGNDCEVHRLVAGKRDVMSPYVADWPLEGNRALFRGVPHGGGTQDTDFNKGFTKGIVINFYGVRFS